MEEEICQQLKLIKLEDLDVVSLEEIKRTLEKKYDKKVFDDEINKIGEELNIDEIKSNIVNNVTESFRRNTHFMRPKYVPSRHITNFSFGFIQRKTTSFKEISMTPIS